MKRILLIFAALCLILAGCGGKQPEPTAPTVTEPTEPQMKTVWVRTSQTSETRGRTSRTELIYGENDRVTEAAVWVNDTETLRYAVECDENGNFIRWTSHEEVQEYTYDDQGRLLTYNCYTGETLTTGYEFTYDASGNRTRVRLHMDRLGVVQQTDYIYDEKGQNIRQEVYLGDELSRYSDCVCDEEGRLLTLTTYTADGKPDLITDYTYEGTVETQVSRNANGELIQTIVITRDTWGNIVRTESYSAAGVLLVTETTAWKAIAVPIDCPRASV